VGKDAMQSAFGHDDHLIRALTSTSNRDFRARDHQDEMLALFWQARDVYVRMIEPSLRQPR
jgi:hypothetical protein